MWADSFENPQGGDLKCRREPATYQLPERAGVVRVEWKRKLPPQWATSWQGN